MQPEPLNYFVSAPLTVKMVFSTFLMTTQFSIGKGTLALTTILLLAVGSVPIIGGGGGAPGMPKRGGGGGGAPGAPAHEKITGSSYPNVLSESSRR